MRTAHAQQRIRDIYVPITPVARLHQRLFNRKRKTAIPVKSADEINQPKESLSAYLLDPEYVSTQPQPTTSHKSIYTQPTKPHTVYQYSRISRPDAPSGALVIYKRKLAGLLAKLRTVIISVFIITKESAALRSTYSAVLGLASQMKRKYNAVENRLAQKIRLVRAHSGRIKYRAAGIPLLQKVNSASTWKKVAVPSTVVGLLVITAAFSGLFNNTNPPASPSPEANEGGSQISVSNGSDSTESITAPPSNDPAGDPMQDSTQSLTVEPNQNLTMSPSDPSLNPVAADFEIPAPVPLVGGRGGGASWLQPSISATPPDPVITESPPPPPTATPSAPPETTTPTAPVPEEPTPPSPPPETTVPITPTPAPTMPEYPVAPEQPVPSEPVPEPSTIDN